MERYFSEKLSYMSQKRKPMNTQKLFNMEFM